MNTAHNRLSIVWLRRDLRLYDHAALASALETAGQVQPIFVFDTDVLARFVQPRDRRLSFIAETLCALDKELRERGGGLLVLHGSAREMVPKLVAALDAGRVFAAEDYEPGAITRDKQVAEHVPLTLVKDQLIFDPREVLKGDGTPYKVYTPYARAWNAAVGPASYAEYAVKDQGRYADVKMVRKAAEQAGLSVLSPEAGLSEMLQRIGYQYKRDDMWTVGDARVRLKRFVQQKVGQYATARDVPAEEGTSRISPYLRFGLVSVREVFRLAGAEKNAGKWLSELLWREFYAMILFHYPESATQEWQEQYRGVLKWSRNQEHFDAWKRGMTGYPIVDAAMRELLECGWMHNRARMIVASFLTKDLHIDWRWGEEHFAQYLMDYEQASNVGGWQWAASTGTDAQPYFRVFNPVMQSKKFDPKGEYIARYVPELSQLSPKEMHEPWNAGMFASTHGYPQPIVDHDASRKKTLEMFSKARTA